MIATRIRAWRRVCRRFTPALLLLLPLLASPSAAQEGTLDLASLQSVFSQAKELFESPNQPACIQEFTKIIDALSAKEGKTPDELFLLRKSLEYRARANFNSGDDSAALADLRTLITADPSHQISREEVSPKFYGQYEALRGSLIGLLRVSTVPMGASVYLDGQSIGTTDIAEQPVLAGSHKLRVERKGFEPISEDVLIQARQTLVRTYPLVRTAASLSVTTIPAGVEITMDGQPAGKTPQGETEISMPLVVDGLGLGRHLIDFRKPCYESATRALTIENIQDLEIPTVQLAPSVATLSISSTIPGEAFIDGTTSLGKLPVTDAQICSGPHTVEAVFAAGKYAQMITARKDEKISLVAEPRPSLAFLGIHASDRALEPRAKAREQEVAARLSAVPTFNVVAYSHTDALPLIRRAGLTANSFIVAEGSRSEEEKKLFKEGLERLAAALKVEIVCIGILSSARLQEDLFLNFAAPPSSVVEASYVKTVDTELREVTAKLTRPYSTQRSWIGCQTIDLLGRTGPVVLAVLPEGPAAAARLTTGQEILEAGGKAVPSSAALAAALATVRPGQKILLKVRDPRKDAQPRMVEVAVGASPVEVPVPGNDILYSRIVAELVLAVKTTSDPLARFLLGQCFMRMGDLQGAFAEMQQSQLGGSWGICDGTVAYYKGRILQQLGFKKDAGDAFRQALNYPRATLEDNDGRPVTEAAQRSLRDLGL